MPINPVSGEITAQAINDNLSALDSEKLGKDFLSYVDVRDFGALGGTNDDTIPFESAISHAVTKGYNKVLIPFSEFTVTSVDCQNLIVEGIDTTINGVLKNVSKFIACKINSFDYSELTLSDTPMSVSCFPKVVERYSTDRYYVLTKKPSNDEYLLFMLERGIVTATNSVGGNAQLLRPTSVYDIKHAYVYKHTYNVVNGTWGEYDHTIDAGHSTFRPIKFWRNTSSTSGDYIEFQTTIGNDGKFTLFFYTSASSDPAANVTVNGEPVGTVKLSYSSNQLLIKTFEAAPGTRNIRITTSGNYYIYCAGVNAYKAAEAKPGLEYDTLIFSGGTNNYITNKGAMEYAFYDTDLQLYYGSYHGGETLVSEQLQIDNINGSLSVGNVKVCRSFAIRQTTDINGKFTSNTLYRIRGDGLLELSAHLVGNANLSTLYTCMTTTHDTFTDVVYPTKTSITTDGEVYFGRVNQIIQENPTTGQKITTFSTLFQNDNNSKGGLFVRRTAGAYNKVYYGYVVQSLKNVSELNFQTKWLFE